MNFDLLYSNVVKNCHLCNGTGMNIVTDTSVSFCDCFKYYIFITRMVNLGIPIKHAMNYTNIQVDIKQTQYFMFGEETLAFNTAMSIMTKDIKTVGNPNILVMSSSELYKFFNLDDYDGLMIYNLGLENIKDNSLILQRHMKDVVDKGLYGIFSFSVAKKDLGMYYLDSVKKFVDESLKLQSARSKTI